MQWVKKGVFVRLNMIAVVVISLLRELSDPIPALAGAHYCPHGLHPPSTASLSGSNPADYEIINITQPSYSVLRDSNNWVILYQRMLIKLYIDSVFVCSIWIKYDWHNRLAILFEWITVAVMFPCVNTGRPPPLSHIPNPLPLPSRPPEAADCAQKLLASRLKYWFRLEPREDAGTDGGKAVWQAESL